MPKIVSIPAILDRINNSEKIVPQDNFSETQEVTGEQGREYDEPAQRSRGLQFASKREDSKNGDKLSSYYRERTQSQRIRDALFRQWEQLKPDMSSPKSLQFNDEQFIESILSTLEAH